jgi:hypothetical protein
VKVPMLRWGMGSDAAKRSARCADICVGTAIASASSDTLLTIPNAMPLVKAATPASGVM